MKSYYTAQQIINEALVGIGDIQRERYAEGAMYFLRGYRDFSLYNAFQVKQEWLTVNALNMTVAIPEDCLRVEAVGCNVNGELFPFTESKDMVTPSDPLDAGLRTDRDEDDAIVRSPRSGYGTVGANLEYYFKVDETNRRIILNRLAVDKTRFADRAEVLVTYVSNDITDLAEARVNGDAANMLIAYVEHRLVSSYPEKYDRAYRAEKKDEFEEAQYKYRLLLIPSVSELLDAIYEKSGQNVRV